MTVILLSYILSQFYGSYRYFNWNLPKYYFYGNYSEPNLAKPMVLLDVAYPPNNFIQRYVYEYKHSPHILDKLLGSEQLHFTYRRIYAYDK